MTIETVLGSATGILSAIVALDNFCARAKHIIPNCAWDLIKALIFRHPIKMPQNQPIPAQSHELQEEVMSFLDAVKADFIAAGKWVEGEFESLGHILMAGIEQFNSEYGPKVLAAANAIVPVLAEVATGVSGPDKAKIAAATMGTMLKQQGIEVGVQVAASMINSAIEQVVASLPKPAVPAAPTVNADMPQG